jgi:hypothetical protein
MTRGPVGWSGRPRLVGLILGGLLAAIVGGPIGFLAFLSIALIATVFTIQR